MIHHGPLDSPGLAKARRAAGSLSQLVFVMHKVEIQDGVIQVDASIIGRDLGLEPFAVQSLRRERKLALMKRRAIREPPVPAHHRQRRITAFSETANMNR